MTAKLKNENEYQGLHVCVPACVCECVYAIASACVQNSFFAFPYFALKLICLTGIKTQQQQREKGKKNWKKFMGKSSEGHLS